MPTQEDLQRALAEEETHLQAAQQEVQNRREKIQELHRRLETLPATHPVPEAQKNGVTPRTSADKITLFRSLFRGREDVYPRLWVNAKKNRNGYAPACSNEWVAGICDKPRIKCGECPHRAFLPLDDRVLIDHLQGRHTLGVYPLLPDETCWFLAADFDSPKQERRATAPEEWPRGRAPGMASVKKGWQQDAQAFMETCRQQGVPAALERSRSGQGGHIWVFFSEPVSAATARRMGCFLLTETMSRSHELSMESYDRLFPNQDTMPQGGFGNLIALPLQQGPRKEGNTVFLDGDLEPIPDQWAFLAAIRRMSPGEVETLAETASRQGRVLGVRFEAVTLDPRQRTRWRGDDGFDATPWERSPSGKARHPRIEGSVTPQVHALSAHALFVEKAGLPSALLTEIKRLAAFQNPEFYKKQAMRFSTTGTPRIISAAEEHPLHLALPRGA